MRINYILSMMAMQQPRELVCMDAHFNYYQMGVAGYYLMYRKNRLHDGRRCYYLTDGLAQVLGFCDLHQMTLHLTTLQYWRRFVSVERLKIAIERYHQRQEHFRLLADGMEI